MLLALAGHEVATAFANMESGTLLYNDDSPGNQMAEFAYLRLEDPSPLQSIEFTIHIHTYTHLYIYIRSATSAPVVRCGVSTWNRPRKPSWRGGCCIKMDMGGDGVGRKTDSLRP